MQYVKYVFLGLFALVSVIHLIDSWRDQEAIDVHHASPMMSQLAALREKYDLHMTAERFISQEQESDERFLRK